MKNLKYLLTVILLSLSCSIFSMEQNGNQLMLFRLYGNVLINTKFSIDDEVENIKEDQKGGNQIQRFITETTTLQEYLNQVELIHNETGAMVDHNTRGLHGLNTFAVAVCNRNIPLIQYMIDTDNQLLFKRGLPSLGPIETFLKISHNKNMGYTDLRPVISLLLENGYQINGIPGLRTRTPLDVAAGQLQDFNLSIFLLSKGAKISLAYIQDIYNDDGSLKANKIDIIAEEILKERERWLIFQAGVRKNPGGPLSCLPKDIEEFILHHFGPYAK